VELGSGRGDRHRGRRGGIEPCLRGRPSSGDEERTQPEDRDQNPHEPADEGDQPKKSDDAPSCKQCEVTRLRFRHESSTYRVSPCNVADGIDQSDSEKQEEPEGDPTIVARSTKATIGSSRNAAIPAPIDAPVRFRDAHETTSSTRGAKSSNTRPRTRVEIE
jgi:hypothetical protein